MKDRGPSEFDDVCFAMLAEMDLTKHLGGQQATDELIELCHIGAQTYVLDIGCGVGIAPCHIAKAYGSRVVGVDLRDGMVERAWQRAEREGVGDLTEFRVADARNLPFDDATFDAVVCESVLAFLPEREKAVNEFARVTKPGGYVGISESTWIKDPAPELREQVLASFDGNLDVQSPEEWQALLETGGLKEIVARAKEITVGSEFSNRVKRMGGAKALARLWARVPSVLIKRPVYRSFVKNAFAMPKEVMSYWGYGLYVGRVAP